MYTVVITPNSPSRYSQRYTRHYRTIGGANAAVADLRRWHGDTHTITIEATPERG